MRNAMQKPKLSPEVVIQHMLALSAEEPLTAAEAEAELRAEGVDVDGFLERLHERIVRARLLVLAGWWIIGR